MKSLFTLCYCLLLCTFLSAQSNSRMVFSSIGSTGSVGTDTYSYTVGEALGMTISNPLASIQLTLGFQQPNVLNPLPIEGLNLSAEWSGLDAQITWITQRELNTDFFQVERSLDGQDFAPIGSTPAQGWSDEASSYQLLDKGAGLLSIPQIYYRLRITDLDGQFTHSEVVSLAISSEFQNSVELYPNPASDRAFLRYQFNSDDSGQVRLFTLTGQTLWEGRLEGTTGVLVLPLHAYAQGTYLLRVDHSSFSQSYRLIIQP